MDREDRGILVGMALGDGHLSVRKRFKQGKYAYESAEITIVHSIQQKEYVEHKAELVRKIFGGKHTVREHVTNLPRTGRSYLQYGFSKSNKYFKTLQGIMYRDREKYIDLQVLNMLNPHGIAIWYMDDGHARRNLNRDGWISSVSTDISTCCSKEETETICFWFGKEYDIKFSSYPTKGRFSIRCNTAESHKFARLVEPYIIPSMRYKLSHVADLNLHERQTPIIDCSECGSPVYDKRRKGLCDRCYSLHRYWEVDRVKQSRKYHGPYKRTELAMI